MSLPTHTEVYTRRLYIIPRIFNLETVDATTQDRIRDIYQKAIDDRVNKKLQAKLGFISWNEDTVHAFRFHI